jgi:hypothetical protein
MLMQDATPALALPKQAFAYPTNAAPSGEGEADWATFGWKPDRNSNKPRPRGRGVATFARRLMARERARARRQTPLDLIAPARRRRLVENGR